jgi:ribosome-associated heat shock protein Hsp15
MRLLRDFVRHVDKWLWQARFFKSRSLATRFIEKSRCRIDGRVVDKPHATVMPGMVLTFALGPRVRVVRIVALGERRGPAPEARALYDEIDGS